MQKFSRLYHSKIKHLQLPTQHEKPTQQRCSKTTAAHLNHSLTTTDTKPTYKHVLTSTRHQNTNDRNEADALANKNAKSYFTSDFESSDKPESADPPSGKATASGQTAPTLLTGRQSSFETDMTGNSAINPQNITFSPRCQDMNQATT
jgi:hypothetical protein